MMLAFDPKALAPQDRLDEVASILATGLLRVRRRQDAEKPFSTESSGENCLEVPAEIGPLVTVG
jgi:hypothetical protein